jgi:hypothetical protein
MFGICLWKEDEYYNNNFPAIQRLEEVPQIRRGEPWPVAPGGTSSPAFVVGEPDFHFVVLAPGLETSWFFDSAQAYWNRFRPTLTSSWAFFDFIPPDRSLAATVIAPPDMADTMRQSIQERYPAALFDLLITSGDLNTVSNVLNARVWADRRFG